MSNLVAKLRRDYQRRLMVDTVILNGVLVLGVGRFSLMATFSRKS